MEVFFYGLFMDVDILKKYGVNPSDPRKAYLDNYTLKIGSRATLVPSEGDRSYGILMKVDADSIEELYSEVSVSDYLPLEVSVISETGEAVSATCYNLPPEKLSGTNASYARSLYQLAKGLEFPADYLEKILLLAGKNYRV